MGVCCYTRVDEDIANEIESQNASEEEETLERKKILLLGAGHACIVKCFHFFFCFFRFFFFLFFYFYFVYVWFAKQNSKQINHVKLGESGKSTMMRHLQQINGGLPQKTVIEAKNHIIQVHIQRTCANHTHVQTTLYVLQTKPTNINKLSKKQINKTK